MYLNSTHTPATGIGNRLSVLQPSPSFEVVKNDQSSTQSFFSNKVVPMRRKPSFEEQLLEQTIDLVLENLDNPNYRVTDLASQIAYSQRHLERVIRKLTGLSPVAFVREIRLQEAYKMLANNTFRTISEVRFEVGIEHPSYFKRKFEERFGVSPAEVKM